MKTSTIALAALLTACGSTATSTTDAGTHHDAGKTGEQDSGALGNVDSGGAAETGLPEGPATVYLTSTLGATTTGTQTCSIDEPQASFVNVGTPGEPVADGTESGGNEVTVTCAVKATTGGAFSVSLSVTDGQIALLTMSGTLQNTPDAQSGVVATFEDPALGDYTQSDCTFTLSTEANPAITGGRMWGTLSCPTLTDASSGDICDGTATIIVQNCTQ